MRLLLRLMPGCRLEIFEDSGHFPFNNHPHRFASNVSEFIETTEPADISEAMMHELIARSTEKVTEADAA